MSRDITANMVTQVTANELSPILLVKAEFDGGTLRFWTGIGEIVFDGETYLGSGDLLGFSAVEESEEVQANNVTISLTGLEPSLIAIALGEDYQGRPITVWFGALDNVTEALITDPFVIFKGRMDVMQIDNGGDTAVINLRCENSLISLRRPKERRYTSEDQKLDYPTDTFFDQVESLQDTQLTWGRTQNQ